MERPNLKIKREWTTLLDTLLSFYQKRYSGSELEDKFKSACEEMVADGDIELAFYHDYCTKNGIAITKKAKPKVNKITHFDDFSTDGCNSRGYRRSHC